MPKNDRPNNQLGSQREPRHAKAQARHITSIAVLLTATPTLRKMATQAVEKQALIDWIRGQLAEELRPHACGAEFKAETLIVTADTAAWSTRLRYAMAALQPEVSAQWPKVTTCQVRVRPSRRS
jgi:hypothetical protein